MKKCKSLTWKVFLLHLNRTFERHYTHLLQFISSLRGIGLYQLGPFYDWLRRTSELVITSNTSNWLNNRKADLYVGFVFFNGYKKYLNLDFFLQNTEKLVITKITKLILLTCIIYVNKKYYRCLEQNYKGFQSITLEILFEACHINNTMENKKTHYCYIKKHLQNQVHDFLTGMPGPIINNFLRKMPIQTN